MKACKACKNLFPPEEFTMYGYPTSNCKPCERQRHRTKGRAYYHKNRQKLIQYSLEYNKAHRAENNKKDAIRRENRKMSVLTHYGGNPPKCACCGETELMFLCIDHVLNNGRKERDALKGGGHHNYRHIIKSGFPDGLYRVLCYNCNSGRWRNGGTCPHGNI